MKISRIKKYITIGIDLAREIKKTTSKDDLKVVRCILGKDEKNVASVLRFLGIFPGEWNKVIALGMFIELTR